MFGISNFVERLDQNCYDIKTARCATKSKSKQTIVNFGFFDKTLCNYPLEIVTYWSQEMIFKLLNFGQETRKTEGL